MRERRRGVTAPSGRRDPLVLVVLDGWGEAPDSEDNAVARARLVALPALTRQSASALLDASGAAVGLPAGVMGNSEVGHLTIGAGRVVEQDLVRIGVAVRSEGLAALPVLRDLSDAVRGARGRLHYFGLCSDAGVHSDVAHLRALVQIRAREGH